jgi:hypothetical protein
MAQDYAAFSTVMVRECGRSSIPETSAMESKSLGVLDTFAGMTAVGGVRCYPSLREAKRRSNPAFLRWRDGLLRWRSQ